MELTKSQKLEFYREGFLKIEGAVPQRDGGGGAAGD